MLSPRALRFALLDLAECGRAHVMDVDAALQVAAAWCGATRLGQTSSHWIVDARDEPARRPGAESPGARTSA